MSKYRFVAILRSSTIDLRAVDRDSKLRALTLGLFMYAEPTGKFVASAADEK